VNLRMLIEGISFLDISGSLDIEIEGIAYDSRMVLKNYLFVSMGGYATDGHFYIGEAISRGAAAVIVEKDFVAENTTVIWVKNSRKILPIISSRFYNNPTNVLKLIGITGTNGKTTTAYLIKSILESWNKRVGLIGTIAVEIGAKKIDSMRTTPESLDLHKMFMEMVDEGLSYVIMEVSSHSLIQKRVEGCNFHIGAFTNLSQDHLDFHKDMESYRKAKEKLFYMTKYANVINCDDKEGRKIIHSIKNIKTPLITVGIDNKADVMAKNIEINDEGVSFTLVNPDYTIPIRSKIPGRFSVYNCLVAAAVAYVEGVDKKAVCDGIESLKSVAGRVEVVNINTPYKVIIDYAHTPDGLENILVSIRNYAEGKIITVFGCGGDRDKGKRSIMGKIAGTYSDFCILTSDNPRSEEPYSIIRQIEKGIVNTGCSYICIENRKDAIREAMKIAKKGDIILLAGKGHERNQELSDKIIDFDEREIVKMILKEDLNGTS
jgi:UDP-N-acetylmuramoyl-L-alanyl-D-glutamate--2,6-diaminopimelate ligase